MAKLLQRSKDIQGCEIREYLDNKGNRYFTATILKWKNFKFLSDKLTPQQLLTEKVIPLVREIRDALKPLSINEQMLKVDEYKSIYKF